MDIPQDPNIVPAPASPASVPGIPPQPGELSPEEMKANLQDLMAKIDEKYKGFEADKFSTDNKVKEGQSMTLRNVFDLLQSVGIDPNNIDQVRGFLDKMKVSDPKLYDQLEQVLQSLMGDDSSAPTGAEGALPPGGTNMNINQNEAPQQTI